MHRGFCLTYPLMRTQVVSNFFCFTNNTATNDPVQMSFFTCTSSMLVLDMLAFFIYLLSQFPGTLVILSSTLSDSCTWWTFSSSLVWIVRSMKLLSPLDYWTVPPGCWFLLLYLGKSKVSAAWQWLPTLRLLAWEFLDFWTINSSLNLCETQALACDFSGRTFHTDSKQRQTRSLVLLLSQWTGCFPVYTFPEGGPPSMPAISRGFILFIQ